MTRAAHLDLSDGRRLEYAIKESSRAKSVRLKMTIREGLSVTVPKRMSLRRIQDLLAGKRDWIAAQLAKFDEVRHLLGEPETARPEAFDLPSLAETWRIEYLKTTSVNVGARTDRQGRIVVYGAVEDHERCKAALRRWLARRAKAAFEPWMMSLSAGKGLKVSCIKIKSQRTRWGSCSARGVITLNCKMLFLPKELVRYVMIHELCHLLERNHSSKFWTYLRQFEPETDALNGSMRDAWKRIPTWAHPLKGRGDSGF